MDHERKRRLMVEEQLKGRGIENEHVLNAFLEVERHLFVPEDLENNAYDDRPLSIGSNQTISQPYMVALMTEVLGIDKDDKVLEIGTGSGYQTAILSKVSKEVCSIERIGALAEKAESLLAKLGFSNIKYKVGDGTLGWPEESPFDKIIVTAATPRIPDPLINQLKDRGRIVLPLGGSFGQILTLIEKNGQSFIKKDICGCTFVPLIGKYGY